MPEEDRLVRSESSRPLWPWLLLCFVFLAAIAVLLILLLRDSAPAPAQTVPAAPAQTAAPAVETPLPSPSPSPELIVISPTPAPPTAPPETPSPAPATPAPETGSPVQLEGEQLYRINIFLSNFSEQSFGPFNISTAPDDQMMHFVELYCKINHPSCIGYAEGDEILSLSDMNTYLKRFFGVTREPYNGATYMLDAWNSFVYRDGYFRFPAADGESYNKFTVVYEMRAQADGSYTVYFQNYELGLEEYWNTPGVDNSFYWLNNDQAAKLVWDSRILPVQGGVAVVRDYNFNGRQTYQLVSYEVWEIGFSP